MSQGVKHCCRVLALLEYGAEALPRLEPEAEESNADATKSSCPNSLTSIKHDLTQPIFMDPEQVLTQYFEENRGKVGATCVPLLMPQIMPTLQNEPHMHMH
jgi:hypothetical protein